MAVHAIGQVPDDLLDLKQNLLDRQVILSGALDAKLNELRSLKNEVSIKQGIVDTVDKASLLKSDAESYAAKFKADADSLMDKARSSMSEAQSRLNEALAKEEFITTDLVKREQDLQQVVQNLANREQALQIKSDSLDTDMKTREEVLVNRQNKMNAQYQQFQIEKSAFQAKVEAIMGAK